MVRVRRAECDLELVEPTEADEVRVLDYKREHFACGETVLNGGSLLGRMDSYPAWLARLRSNRSRATVPRDWVVADTLLAVRRSDGRMVGRHPVRTERLSPAERRSHRLWRAPLRAPQRVCDRDSAPRADPGR